MLLNTLATDGKYPVEDCENWQLPMQMELSERGKSFFLNFLIHFCDLHQILNILLKNMMVIVNIFLKLQTAKNFVNVCQVLAKSP